MRVVLDTNVVVSALIWSGTPYRLLEAAADGDIELFTSPVLIAELREVLRRPQLASRLTQQRSSVEHAVTLYNELAAGLSPLSTPRAVPKDADDDHVIACASAAQADLIVSGDADLLELSVYQGMRIVTPTTALAFITKAPR